MNVPSCPPSRQPPRCEYTAQQKGMAGVCGHAPGWGGGTSGGSRRANIANFCGQTFSARGVQMWAGSEADVSWMCACVIPMRVIKMVLGLASSSSSIPTLTTVPTTTCCTEPEKKLMRMRGCYFVALLLVASIAGAASRELRNSKTPLLYCTIPGKHFVGQGFVTDRVGLDYRPAKCAQSAHVIADDEGSARRPQRSTQQRGGEVATSMHVRRCLHARARAAAHA